MQKFAEFLLYLEAGFENRRGKVHVYVTPLSSFHASLKQTPKICVSS